MSDSNRTKGSIAGLGASEINKAARLASAPASSEEFTAALQEDPVSALAAKGIDITPDEAADIKGQLERLGGTPAAKGPEIGITIKQKF